MTGPFHTFKLTPPADLPPRRINTDVLDVMEKLASTREALSASRPRLHGRPPFPQADATPGLEDIAVRLGLPAEPGPKPQFSHFSWAQTPHLRLSREGRQLLVSSGPPMRMEMARQREQWEKAVLHRNDLLSIKASPRGAS